MVRAAYRRRGFEADVEPFLYDMGRQLRTADLVVCRAGATTLAEMTAAGKAAMLVPLPTATDDHQRKNAEALAARGRRGGAAAGGADRRAARGADARAGRRSRQRRARMAAAARALARPDAASVIVDRALELAWQAGRTGPGELRVTGDGAAVLGRTRRVHFVGIGGIGMSGIAELLANLGYVGQRVGREAIGGDRPAGVRSASASTIGHDAGARGRRRRRRRLVGGASRRTRKCVEAAAAADPGDSAGRDARRADAAALRDRGGRRRTARRRRRR